MKIKAVTTTYKNKNYEITKKAIDFFSDFKNKENFVKTYGYCWKSGKQ
tara:strand:+ start:249 stop:392 length:144 start_codon:yes stop_codon:yes gene_type:complete